MKIVKVGSTKLEGHKVPTFRVPTTTEAKVRLAAKFRNNPTDSELLVYNALKARGYKFEFQKVLFGYIADFYFPGRNYIVELDGRWHDELKDSLRDDLLRRKGIKTLRIESKDCFHSLKWVMRLIESNVSPRVEKSKPKAKRKKKHNKARSDRTDETLDAFMFATDGL